MTTKMLVSVVSLAAILAAVLFTPSASAQTPAAAPAAPACTPPTCAVPKPPKNECGSKSLEEKTFEAAQCAKGDGTIVGTYDDKVCHCDLVAPNVGKNELETLAFCRLRSDESKSGRSVHPKLFCDNMKPADSSGPAALAKIDGDRACKRLDENKYATDAAGAKKKADDQAACNKNPGIDRRLTAADAEAKSATATASAADGKATKAQADVDATKADIEALKGEHNALAEAVLGAEIDCAAKAIQGATQQVIADCTKKKQGLVGRLASVDKQLETLGKVIALHSGTIYGVYNDDGSLKTPGLVTRIDALEARFGAVEAFLAKWQLRGGLAFGFDGRLQPAIKADGALMRGNSALAANLGVYLSAGSARLSFSGGRSLEEIKIGTGGTGKVAGNTVSLRGSYLPWKPWENISTGFSLGFRHGETNVSPASGGAWALATGVSPGFQLEAEVGDYLAVVVDATVGYDWVAATNNGHDATNPKGVTGSLGITFVLRTPVVTP